MAHKSFLFFSALVNSIINGANLMQTAKNTFTGGFWGGVSGFANFEIGNLENVYMKIAAHSVSEGAMEGIRGGHFEHGFFTGMTSTAGGSLLNGGMCDRLSAAERIAVNAALGGIVSELGGGKFASGAMTAAYVMMFNELKHKYRVRRSIKFKKICQVAFSDSPSAAATLTLKAVVNIIETHLNGKISLDAFANSFSTTPDAVNTAIEISALGDENTISSRIFSKKYTGPEVLPTGWIAVGEAHISPFKINCFHKVEVKVTPTWSFSDYGMGRCVPNLFSIINLINVNMFNSKSYRIK